MGRDGEGEVQQQPTTKNDKKQAEEMSVTEIYDGSSSSDHDPYKNMEGTSSSSSSSDDGDEEMGIETALKNDPVITVVKVHIEDDDDKSKEGDDANDAGEIQKQEKKTTPSKCSDHPRVKELYQSADWWSLWIGLSTFGLAMATVFGVPLHTLENVKYAIPQPEKWEQNPLDAWNVYNLIGIPILLILLMASYVTSLYSMGKLDPKGEDTTTRAQNFVNAAKGFSVMSILAVFSMWLGQNVWASDRGLGYAIFAILFGMLLGNTVLASGERLPWLLQTAKDGEFFIKCSLTLLAIELDVLVSVGVPGMLVAWIGSPLAIAAGFVLGMRLFRCKDTLSLLIAVGASWCGASAISAVAPVVSASSEDVTLAISVVAFFTVIFTFVQPYIAMAVDMPHDVAGAWIGASVDQTGNVIVSAAILSDEATEVAGIVKMVLNAGLGVMASVVACYWNSRRSNDDEKKEFKLIMLWDKFPKFTLGFVITSAILTGTMQGIRDTHEEDALPHAISTMNKWWFAIAFVGIGLTTNIKTLFEKAWSSGVIQVYLLANTIDILLALGLSYLAYGHLV